MAVDDVADTAPAAGLADTVADDAPPTAAASERLPRGAQLGRYLILDQLGAGGMGVVYRAYDPELDRRVAVKLLQVRRLGGGDDQQQWLLREAQALARLSHPNVVAIYDVGSLTLDRVFIAMELVEGLTLRAWLAAAERSWRDIIPIMLGAGAGLVAAHAVGLVHRDFKPDNVIVGADGRVRVMDFGLARLRRADTGIPLERTSELTIEQRSPLSAPLTVAGAIIGTPTYIAPEVYAGRAADARSDQFAFGVALYEALYGASPFDMEGLVEGTAVPPKPPATRGVPARIERVVLRAIAIDRDARFDSIEALMSELAIERSSPSRRGLVVAAAIVAVSGIVTIGAMAGRSSSHVCEGIDQRLVGAWDPTVEQTIHAAYLQTKLPFAELSFAALSRALDRYTTEWTTVAVESCKATRVRRDQTEEVLSLRQACLDQRLDGVRALTQALASDPSSALVERADGPVFGLDAIATCSNVQALREPGMHSDDQRVRDFEHQISLANAQLITGKYLPALTATQHILDDVQQLGFPPIEAQAQMTRAMTMLAVQNNEEAVKGFIEAVRLGLASHRDDIAASAAVQVAGLTAIGLHRPGEARAWLTIAKALAVRLGMPPAFELGVFMADGIVAAELGDPVAALAAHEKMYSIATHLYQDASQPRASAEMQLATSMTRAFEYARAIPHFEKAIQIDEDTLGRDHPDIATVVTNLGVCFGRTGDIARARAAFERALDIRERTYGRASAVLVVPLMNYADLLNTHGDPSGALVLIDRATSIAEGLGKDTAYYQLVATTRGEIYKNLGRFDDARQVLDEVIAGEERGHSSSLPATLMSRADLALATKAWADAAGFAERSITGFEAAGGKDNPELFRPLAALGHARLELGQLADARPVLERAIALGTKTALPDGDLASARADVARATAPPPAGRR